jgi:ATP-binding protein involved in chromosome partitioning
MVQRVEVPVLGIVENMSTFICPHCGTETQLFGHGGARHEAETLGVPFLGEVPLHIAIREMSDAGTPVVATDPAGPHAAAYRLIAERAWAEVGRLRASGRRVPPRIVIDT